VTGVAGLVGSSAASVGRLRKISSVAKIAEALVLQLKIVFNIDSDDCPATAPLSRVAALLFAGLGTAAGQPTLCCR
jgi:hypothetical protein